jgi:protease-4
VLNQVIDQIYNDFCTKVGQGRRKSVEEIRGLLDGGPYVAPQAKANGLVDELGYEDQVYSDLKKRTGGNDLKKLNVRTYFRAVPGKGDRIALIVGQGEIVRSAASRASFSALTHQAAIRLLQTKSCMR